MKLIRGVAFCCFVLCAVTARADSLSSLGIGVYGDSLSMQYSFWLPLAPQFGYSVDYTGTQFNWVDQLVSAGYDFGPPLTIGGETLNSYDVAIAGYKSADLAECVPNLQSAVTSGAVSLVVDMIGANDFDDGEYRTIYNNAANPSYNPLTDPAVIAFEKTLVSNIATSIQETLAENPNVHMILGTIPNMGLTPSYESRYTSVAQRAVVTEVIQAVNAQIIALGATYGFPVVDLFGLTTLSTTLTSFAGVKMIDAGGDSGQDIFLSDGFHPGTVSQGLIANTILQADYLAYGDSITPLSDQTIAESAGLTPTGPSPTYFDIDPYVIYTPQSVPEPSTLVLGLVGLSGLSAVRLWKKSRCA